VRICALELRRIQIPLRGAFEHARASRAATDNIVCAVTLDGGIVGYGEGVPRDYVTGETPETMWATLAALALPAQPVTDITGAFDLAAAVTGGIEDGPGVIQNACRAAIELAILDAYGKAFACSITPPLIARAGTRPGPVCTHSMVLDRKALRDPDRLRQLRDRYGFRAAKLKVGFGLDEDIQNIAALRAILGGAAEIRVDANRAWTFEQAVATMTRAKQCGVDTVEDPLAGDTIAAQAAGLRRLREEGFRVVLDEPIRIASEVDEAIAESAVDVLNLRVSKNGGLVAAARLARRAQDAGIGLQVGTQVGETAILSAAGRHLSYCAGPVLFLESSNEHMKFDRDNYLSEEDLNYDEHATSQPLIAPGLGITILPERLERFTTAQLHKQL
jgi:muconate cycloisomerase